MLERIMKVIPWLVAVLAVSSALYFWYNPREVAGPVQWLDGTVTLTRTKYVPTKLQTPDCTVQTVDADRDKLPDIFQGNPVTALGETGVSKTGFDLRTTISTSTGETRIYYEPKKQSLLGFENEKGIGGRYGYVSDRDGIRSEVDLFGQWSFFRTGNIYLGVYGEINTRPEGKAMLQIFYP